MKIALVLAASTAVAHGYDISLHFNYNIGADPCAKFPRRQCNDEKFCVFTEKPRNRSIGKNEQKTYGRHTGPSGKGGNCAMIHLHDRANLGDNAKLELQSKFSVGGGWDNMSCSDAYWLKDCKDLNQHFAGSGSNKCAWTCEDGCVDATGDAVSKKSYENCSPCPKRDDIHCNNGCTMCIVGPLAHEGRGAFVGLHPDADGGHHEDMTDSPYDNRHIPRDMGPGDWAIFGDDGSSVEMAQVVCREMGYDVGDQVAYVDEFNTDAADDYWSELEDNDATRFEYEYNGVDYGRFPVFFEPFNFRPRSAGDGDYGPWEYWSAFEPDCAGNEASIWDCPPKTSESNNSGPDEIAGVDCFPFLANHYCDLGGSNSNGICS